MRVPLLIITLLAHAMIVHVAGPDAFAQTNPPQAQSGPQDRRSTGADARPGETLSERLDRTDGVIRPHRISPRRCRRRVRRHQIRVLRPSYRRRVPRGETNKSSPSRLDSDKGDPFLSDVARNLYRAPGRICYCRSLCDFLAQFWSSRLARRGNPGDLVHDARDPARRTSRHPGHPCQARRTASRSRSSTK